MAKKGNLCDELISENACGSKAGEPEFTSYQQGAIEVRPDPSAGIFAFQGWIIVRVDLQAAIRAMFSFRARR
jgi:hypothetical protein